MDSAVFSEEALSLLVEVMGEDRVILGSNYPFPLGEQEIGKRVREQPGFSGQHREIIRSLNAARFLNLDLGNSMQATA